MTHWSRSLITATATVMVFAAPAQSKSPARITALDVAPVEAKFGLAVQGLTTHADKARALANYMKRVGLEAPNFEHLVEELARAADADGKTPWPRSMGLAPSGFLALYGVTLEGRPQEVVALDVVNKKAFVAFLVRQEERDQWLEDGKKPRKAKVTRKRLRGGIEEVTVTLPNSPGQVVRFKGGVAALAPQSGLGLAPRGANNDRAAALDTIAWGGTPAAPSFRQLTRDPDQLAVGFWGRPGELFGETDPVMTTLETVSGTLVMSTDGMHFESTATLGSDATPFVSVARPGPLGANARRAMQSVAADASMWFRLSLSSSAGLALARMMGGQHFEREVKDIERELGLDPVTDIAEVLTGDALVSCHDGLTDCVLAIGVSDARRAEKAARKVFKSIERAEAGVHLHTSRAKLDKGPKSAVLLRTTVFEQAVDKRGKLSKRAERNDLTVVSWGTRPHLLLLGLTPHGVERALRRETTPKTSWPVRLRGPDGAVYGFDDTTTMASYQRVGEPSTTLRQLLPIARHALPESEWPGIVVRLGDLMAAFQDRMIDGSATLRSEGLSWRLETTVEMLPTAGQVGHDPMWEARYEAALEQRYKGLIRTSNEALLALSNDAPDTAWGEKARLLALGGDGSLFSGMTTLGVLAASGATAFEAFTRAAGASDAWSERGPCDALMEYTCPKGPDHRPKSCDIGGLRDPIACEEEFRRVMSL
jgi:hypothetical protein